jgi:hypothetical protein
MDISANQPARGRVATNETQRVAFLAAFESSGLTQKAFAQREGINYHTFVSWLVQQRRAAKTASARGTPIPSGQMTDTNSGRLEVSLPGEIVVRGDNPFSVASLVHSLRRNLNGG